MTVIVLCRDLMFSSKIRSAADACGVTTQMLRDPVQLIGAPADLLLVDLNQENTIDPAANWKAANPGSAIMGFVGHTDSETIDRAKKSGFDKVLTRGQFAATLLQLFEQLAQRRAPSNPNS
jgi:hypothetical protein